jgi:hypothetical protein
MLKVRERREHAARRREPFASFGSELPLSIVLAAIQNGESWVYPLELVSDIEDEEQIGEVCGRERLARGQARDLE